MCELERYFSPGTFDAVLLNGVIGFGVDDAALADRAIRAIATVLRGDGWLVIGWDTNRGVDPMALGSTRSYFRRSPLASLPSRIEIDGSPHIYDQLRRVPS